MWRRTFPWLAILALLFVACGPAATPTPQPLATPTTAPTAAPRPTVAPPPGATATPVPKATPTAAPSVPQEAKPKYGGILTTRLITDPRGPDTFGQPYSDVNQPVNPIHDRLVYQSTDLPPCALVPLEPALAQSWKWLDDKTLEVKLREGVRFPGGTPFGGRPFVADDVVYSVLTHWSRVPPFSAGVAAIAKVKALDSRTVVFELTMPLALFPEKVLANTHAKIVGREMFLPDNTINTIEANVGLGPFGLESWTPGVSVRLRRNPAYWQQGLPYVDGIHMRIMPDDSTAHSAIRAGKLDFLYSESQPALIQELVQSAPSLQHQICSGTTVPVMGMRADQRPFDSVEVRRALSLAVDREAIKHSIYLDMVPLGYTSVHTGFGPLATSLADYPPDVRKYLEYQPTDAKNLLAKAGYPTGFETKILYTPRFRVQAQIAESLSAMFEKVGIKATLGPTEYARFAETVYQAKYEGMTVRWLGAGDDLDSTIWDSFHSSEAGRTRNFSYVRDKEMDSLLERFRRATDTREQEGALRLIQIRQVEQVYYIAFAPPPVAAFFQPYVKNIAFKPYLRDWQAFLTAAWLDRTGP